MWLLYKIQLDPLQPPLQLPIFLPSLHWRSSMCLLFFFIKYKTFCKKGNNKMCEEIAWGLGIARSFMINTGGVAVNAFLSIQFKTFVKGFLQQFFPSQLVPSVPVPPATLLFPSITQYNMPVWPKISSYSTDYKLDSSATCLKQNITFNLYQQMPLICLNIKKKM